MGELSTTLKNFKASKIIFIASLFNAIFWGFSKTINVYGLAIVGAIFEILWLPALVALLLIPLAGTIFWIKDGFNLKSLNLYAIVIAVFTLMVTLFYTHQGVK